MIIMDELYGLQSTVDHDYSMQHTAAADDDDNNNNNINIMVGIGGTTTTSSWTNYNQLISSSSSPQPPPPPPPPVTAVYGSEHFGSGSSGISDAASMVAVAHDHLQRNNRDNNNNNKKTSEEEVSSAIRDRIASHPLYPKLLDAYIDCQKVGVPPEMVDVLDEIRRQSVASKRIAAAVSSCFGADPELDVFMETYCDILAKYKSDLLRPFDEATTFLSNMETQLSNLCNNNGVSRSYGSDEGGGSSEEELLSGSDAEVQDCYRAHLDRELKDKLISKYGGYISSLKHQFSKKKKKTKLPKDARQVLFDWWNLHYKWPYPTEADKIALAETTGLDQKQINNWFINQRKRHWKPSENMQLTVMESLYGPFS